MTNVRLLPHQGAQETGGNPRCWGTLIFHVYTYYACYVYCEAASVSGRRPRVLICLCHFACMPARAYRTIFLFYSKFPPVRSRNTRQWSSCTINIPDEASVYPPLHTTRTHADSCPPPDAQIIVQQGIICTMMVLHANLYVRIVS